MNRYLNKRIIMKFRSIFLLVFLCGFSMAEEKVKVACIGDSITYGKGIANRETHSYPARLQALLGDGYEVRNFGSSGRGAIKSSRRGKGWRAFIKQKEHFQALEFLPDVVICNLGINDIMDYRNGHVAEFVPDYLELLASYKNLPSHPRIFIWTKLMPLCKDQKFYRWEEPFVLRLDLERVAAKSDAVGLDLFSAFVGREELFQDDAIHPTAQGYEVAANETYRQILPCLTGNFGGLKLSYVYGDHMVLQRGEALRFQGIANSGESVTVRFAGKTETTAAGEDGRWEIRIPPMEAGGPYALEFQALGKTVRFEDVMVGEVWIAAGQSNMELPLKMCWGGKKEIAHSGNPLIRLLDRKRTVPKGKKVLSEEELSRCTKDRFYEGSWAAASPESVSDFSGVAYFFAKKLQQELGIAVGVVHVAIGGAPCEAFAGEEAILANPLLRGEVASNEPWFDNLQVSEWCRGRAKLQLKNWIDHPATAMPGHPFQSAFLYRAAIQPLEQFPIRGCIWYQGESNATAADGMEAMPKAWCRAGLETLIADWRRQFAQGDFPFYFVQLPNYENHNWMPFREMQLEVSKEVPNTGMVVTIDVGDSKNVHPKNKRPVGDRLANLALAKTYGKAVAYSGPAYRKLTVEAGSRLRVLFDFADGLHPVQGTDVAGFEIAGEDGVFHPAHATIETDSVILRSPGVPSPVAVRYGWKGNPDCNLVNSAKLPASPFRATAFSKKAETLRPISVQRAGHS